MPRPSDVAAHVLAAAAGAALSWCACMVPWLWDPDRPRAARRHGGRARGGRRRADGLGTTRPGTVATAVRLADAAVADGSRRNTHDLRPGLREVEQRFFRALPHRTTAYGSPAAARAGSGGDRSPVARLLGADRGPDRGEPPRSLALLATAVGLHNPYWAATTAVAVQLGTGARGTGARRTAGGRHRRRRPDRGTGHRGRPAGRRDDPARRT